MEGLEDRTVPSTVIIDNFATVNTQTIAITPPVISSSVAFDDAGGGTNILGIRRDATVTLNNTPPAGRDWIG